VLLQHCPDFNRLLSSGQIRRSLSDESRPTSGATTLVTFNLGAAPLAFA